MLPSGHFDAGAFTDAADRLVVGPAAPRRYTSLVPVQLARVLDDPRATAALGRFDAVLVGGQATPTALRERARAAGIRVVTTYGASETSGGCVYDGAPLGTVHAELVDGELQLTGPMLAEGYLDDPARTAATFTERDGHRWYRTGDAATIVDGRVRVTGRLDDVVISGGEKVPLGAVERIVRELPGQHGAVVTRRTSGGVGRSAGRRDRAARRPPARPLPRRRHPRTGGPTGRGDPRGPDADAGVRQTRPARGADAGRPARLNRASRP
ncbi:AMP-binding protein [Curtobacterium sp. MCPF17_052]|uniref:AMP-binding protein n=1 Tax=Curtobacterium sp. MCPF17_052 TaxID=2175655 RepID=UPI0024DF3C78|nr:AMP-binding protein [Curtobacterium sp. MCPF17_052]WIB13112.1 AMP-binding protein [Curtobacterium sp. MCPF17_052]